MTIGELVYKITGDSKGLQTEVKKSDSKVKGLGTTFGKFAKLGIAAIAAVGVAVAAKITKELINAASMAEETQNKFNVVFRGIEGDANAAAKNLQDNFGLSGTAAQRMLSDTGDLLVGLGLANDEALALADSAAQLGTDLASFTNFAGGAEGATDALRKAMLGETESAKALGLVLGETQLKEYAERHGMVASQLTLAEKAHIRLAMATEQSVNAIGDFERSSGSYANKSRVARAAVDDLKVAMGEGLLPIATASVSMFGDLTRKLTEFITERNKLKAQEKEVVEGIADTNTQIDVYSRRLQELIDKGRVRGRQAEYQNQQRADEIAYLRALIPALTQQAEAEGILAKAAEEASEAQRKQAELDAEAAELAAKKAEERLTDLAALNEAYASTKEAQIEATEANIRYFESFIQTDKVKAVLADLREDLAKLQETDAERIQARLDGISAEADAAAGFREAEEAFNVLVEEDHQRTLERIEEEKQARIDLYKTIASEGISFLSALDSYQSATAAAELQRLEDAGASEEELEEKKKEIAHKEAKRKKAIATISAIVDTASAIIEALPNYILAAAVGITGAIQLAAIRAAPIPAFASGGIVPSAPGVPPTGDRMLAAVNPGEVILNEAQQRNLANKMGGGGMGNMTIRIIPQEFSKFLQAQFDNQEVFIR